MEMTVANLTTFARKLGFGEVTSEQHLFNEVRKGIHDSIMVNPSRITHFGTLHGGSFFSIEVVEDKIIGIHVLGGNDTKQVGSVNSRLPLTIDDAFKTLDLNFTIICVKCKSHKVRMVNPETLSENAYTDLPYVFDGEAYTKASCDECGHVMSVVGKITWEQPKL
jgi:hypothetical protein